MVRENLSLCDAHRTRDASLVYGVSAFPICRVPLAPFDAQRLTPRHARLHTCDHVSLSRALTLRRALHRYMRTW